MFKSIGGFFRNIVAPISLGILGGPTFGPLLAATYSGINTGIKTGSPLAGLGSAGLSLGLTSAFRGITAGQEAPAAALPVFKETGKQLGAEALTEGTGSALRSSFVQPAFGGAAAREITKTGIGTIPTVTGTSFADRISNVGNIFDADKLKANFVDTTLRQQTPGLKEFLPDIVTERSPLTVAGLGLGLQMAATPPPEPAPFGPMQGQPARDFSKYSYKGPLNRGAYTYADPEDIAYGRVDPNTYGYLGAKEGGTINLADGGGVMMQKGPYNPAIEKQKGTFRPTGSMVAPEAGPGISKIAQLQPMMSVNPQKIAGLAQPVAPTVPTNLPIQAPTPQPTAPMPMPQPNQQQDASKQAMELINRLPKKDLNVDLGQVASALGFSFNEGGTVPSPEDLPEKEFASVGIYKKPTEYETEKMAVGGEVPGMAKQAPAGITGQSSNIDSSVYSTQPKKMNEQEFVDGFLSIMPNNILGNTVRELGLGADVGKQMYQQYKDSREMASGGEVPGMAKQAQAGITGQSSSVGGSNTYSSNPGILNEEDFVAEWMRVMPGSFSKIGSYLDNPQIGRTIYQQYKNYDQPKKEMAEGGEVNSNQTLQENAFVIPADVVGHIGDGSSDAGAQRLQSFLGMNPQRYQAGGIMAGQLNGPGGGMDDLIQTSIEGKRAAAVSPEEFVVPRDIVAEIGRGSYDKGSNKLYALMRNVRQQKTGTTKQPAELTRGLGQLMRTAVA